MAMVPICSVSGRADDLSKVVDAGRSALMFSDAVVFNDPIIPLLADNGFGVLKADSYIARDITELAFSHDVESNLVTVTTLSPSHLIRRGNQAPLIGAVLPFVADALEDATFAVFIPGPDVDTSSMPLEAFLGKATDMQSGDYIIDDDRWDVDDSGPLSMVTIKGLKSLSQIGSPYMQEINDKANKGANDVNDAMRALGELLIKMADTPKEFDAMLELEFGPVFQYYWMAYSAMRASNNLRDRELRRLYDTKMNDRLIVASPFTSETLTFSDRSIDALKNEHREYLEGKGIDLAKTDRK